MAMNVTVRSLTVPRKNWPRRHARGGKRPPGHARGSGRHTSRAILSMVSRSNTFIRSRPSVCPSSISCSFNLDHASQVTYGTPLWASDSVTLSGVCSGAGGSWGRSANRLTIVAAASALLVPITPVGPRFIQPATYTPVIAVPSGSVTRPSACGTIPASASKGKVGSGAPRCPMACTTACTGVINPPGSDAPPVGGRAGR